MNNELQPLESDHEGLTPWQELPSGHASVDVIIPGLVRAGALQVRLGRAGCGKTSDSYDLVEACAVKNVVLYAHSQEKTDEHVRAMGLQHASRRALAQNVRVKNINSDVAKLAKLLYKGIATSIKRGEALPGVIIIDDIWDLYFPDMANVGSVAHMRMVEDLLRAISKYDLDTVGALTGVYYEDWANTKKLNLTGRVTAVVGYAGTGRGLVKSGPEHLPHLSDIGDLWSGADSIVLIERYSMTETAGRFVALKQVMRGKNQLSVGVPMDLVSEQGKRARWKDTLMGILVD